MFSPLAQGMLTDKYLRRHPGGLARGEGRLPQDRASCTEDNWPASAALSEIAERRGQSLPQMAIAWVLRDPRVTSALIGVRTVEQLEDSLRALERLDFSDDDLAAVEQHAVDSGVNIWAESSRY